MTQVETDELEQIAAALESETPWATVSRVLDHAGWMDLVGTLKARWPVAYEAMRKDVMERRSIPC